jgi:hypothetical protein
MVLLFSIIFLYFAKKYIMSTDTLLGNAVKTQLGMGELFAVIQTGTNTPEEGQIWGFLEVQPDTVITSLTFKRNRDGAEVVVSRYNITTVGVMLIPPVYQGQSGKWVSVTAEGQIYVYGIEPIG